MGQVLQTHIRTNTHREVLELLNELHNLRYLADLSGRHEVVSSLDSALRMYERADRVSGKAGKVAGSGIDELGRAYAMGRRKESSARVWMIPCKSALPLLNGSTDAKVSKSSSDATDATTAQTSSSESTEVASTTSSTSNSVGSTTEADAASPQSEILINHLPLPVHFAKLVDRDAILRPLRLTGLLGAYNIFALVRGGGTTGQAGAVSLAVARALAVLREDVQNVLTAGEFFAWRLIDGCDLTSRWGTYA